MEAGKQRLWFEPRGILEVTYCLLIGPAVRSLCPKAELLAGRGFRGNWYPGYGESDCGYPQHSPNARGTSPFR